MHSSESERPPAPEPRPPELNKDWRFCTGVAALILCLILPLLAFLVPLLGLSTGAAAVTVGLLLAGGPEVLVLLAAALLGKEALHYFLYRVKRMIREAVVVGPVSRPQYYVGLTVCLVSIVPLYLYGYLPHLMPSGDARIYILIGADLSFILAVFMMGGEFWEKLRRLFVWEGS